MEDQIAQDEANRYELSPEEIAHYRETVFPLLFVNQMSAFLQADVTELGKTIQRYEDGAIGMDQFLKEMDQRVRMMEMEAK